MIYNLSLRSMGALFVLLLNVPVNNYGYVRMPYPLNGSSTKLWSVHPKCSEIYHYPSKQEMFVMIRAVTRENRSSGFPTRSDINRSMQSQKMARSLKFRI